MALISDVPRNATIIASDDCVLLSLTRPNFNKIFHATISSKGDGKNKFFDDMFKDSLSKPQIITLRYLFTERIISRRNVIFNEGDDIDKVYLVVQGSIDLYKKYDEKKADIDKQHQDINKRKFVSVKTNNKTEISLDNKIDLEDIAKQNKHIMPSDQNQFLKKNLITKMSNRKHIGIVGTHCF